MVDRNRRALLRTLPLPFLATLSACGGGSGGSDSPLPATPKFAFDGLPGRIVRRLRPGPAGLIAATDDSAWRRTPAGWQSMGLDGVQVQDIAALSATHMLATVRPQAAGMGPDPFLET